MLTRLLGFLPWLLAIFLYAPVVLRLYSQSWENIDYTHAYFILPVALWLAWRKRADLRKAASTDSRAPQFQPASSTGLLLIGILLFIFGWRWDYLSIMAFSIIPVILGLCLFLYGSRTTRLLRFPVLYLLLMVPPPMGILDAITLPMRQAISAAADMILRSFHYPVVREGLLLTIGNQEIYMGAPCSGFRSLVTLLSLGLAYIHISKSPRRTKSILLACLVPLALLGNLIRVLAICLVTYHFGAAAGQGPFHELSGIIMFAVLISGILALEALLNRSEDKT